MRLSKIQWKTYKEIPSEAKIESHRLLVRAGLVHKSAAGIYSYLPMALRVIHKIEGIVREEMEAIECAELRMGFVTPGDLWKQSNRWETMGSELLRFKDANKRDMCLSPTNEEAITDIFKASITSYKQLPLCWYQINTKFRDEIRPRFGLMRCREFIMKDGYSFHMDKACQDQFYDEMYGAYLSIFKRLGLEALVVEADAGNMGSSDSKTHEFQVVAEEGEDAIAYSETYAANLEKAQTFREGLEFTKAQKLEEFSTPEMKTCEDVCKSLDIPIYQSLKSLLITAQKDGAESHYLVMILGDDELNELKLKNFLGADQVYSTHKAKLENFNIPVGFIGPIGIDENFEIVFDNAIDLDSSYVVGAMKEDFHLKGFVPSRELKDFKQADLRLAREGDFDKEGHSIQIKRGIEVGHIFQLGNKYTKSMSATVLDKEGKKFNPEMGCYGLGVTRTMQAAIAQNHDEAGIVWPVAIAPYHVYFALIGKSEEIKELGNEIYKEIKESGIEIIFDDRGMGFGPMMKDADLLGLPIRLVLGERDYKNSGELEIKIRKTAEIIKTKKENMIETLKSELSKL